MHDLVKLHLSAVRTGDRPLARATASVLRSDAPLRDDADRALQQLPRGPARWSAVAERLATRVLFDLHAPTIEPVRQRVEDRAARVLADVPDWIWNGDTLPVPVEHIADSCFGLYVRDMGDLSAAPGVPSLEAGQSLSGLLLPGMGEIWVNAAEARDWPARRRFTISHELGHWCLHRGSGAVWCRSSTVDPAEGPPRRAYPPEESEANEFAAALLMPAHLVRRHYERLRRGDPQGCFEQLCSIFGASGAAMSRRLRAVVPAP
jgi:hypothetical protein